MDKIKRVAVIGGGNIGTQFTCMCASKGYETAVFTSRPEEYDGTLEIVDENRNIISGKISKATSDIAEAMEGCQIVFVTYPAYLLSKAARLMLPYVREGMYICVTPGTGGAEFAFRGCMEKGAFLCGLQRVPCVARLERYGKRVRCEGMRARLHLAAIPQEKAAGAAELMELLWDIPCEVLPNYLSVTLTPSNPVLHTARLRVLFRDHSEGKIYERDPLFYGEWDDESSELLLACDGELQRICADIKELDLTNVRSLRLHYESGTVPELTAKLRSISSLGKLRSPMKQVEGGWAPDFDSRYFAADFPYGLAIIEEIADLTGTDIPNIRETMQWYRRVTGNSAQLRLAEHGILSLTDLYSLYAGRNGK